MPATLLSGFLRNLNRSSHGIGSGRCRLMELAIENRSPQGLPSPALPPEELDTSRKNVSEAVELVVFCGRSW